MIWRNKLAKSIIWDLDNTLYFETQDYKNKLNEATAFAAIKEFNLPLDFDSATQKVKESYEIYRDGLEIFAKEYGIPHKDLYKSYHNYKSSLISMIKPYDNLLNKLKSINCPQYVFSTSSRDICEQILKHIGIYEFFKDRFYSVEDFDVYKKNESSDVYAKLCKKIGLTPQDCIFVDDSYSNLEYAKKIGMTTVRIYYKNNSAKDMDFIDSAYKGIEECIMGLKEDFNC
jgi:sugar-phosphatase